MSLRYEEMGVYWRNREKCFKKGVNNIEIDFLFFFIVFCG